MGSLLSLIIFFKVPVCAHRRHFLLGVATALSAELSGQGVVSLQESLRINGVGPLFLRGRNESQRQTESPPC